MPTKPTNQVYVTVTSFLDDPTTLPIILHLDDQLSFDDVGRAVISLKAKEEAGSDNIPATSSCMVGVLKTEGCKMFLDCRSTMCLQQQLKNASIIHAYKQKIDRAECGTIRDISVPYVAAQVLAKVMLTRLLEHIVYLV